MLRFHNAHLTISIRFVVPCTEAAEALEPDTMGSFAYTTGSHADDCPQNKTFLFFDLSGPASGIP